VILFCVISQGAKKEDIEALKTEVFEGGNDAPNDESDDDQDRDGHDCGAVRCTVCLEEPVNGDLMRVLPCSHRFHQACIDQWLAVKACCPICQGDIRQGHREASAAPGFSL
jgi:hypothetical protein